MKKQNNRFKVIRGLDVLNDTTTDKLVTVSDKVTIELRNGESIIGILLFTSESSVSIRTSEYEYTNTGVKYEQALILTKDIESISSFGKNDKNIDWRSYSEALDIY